MSPNGLAKKRIAVVFAVAIFLISVATGAVAQSAMLAGEHALSDLPSVSEALGTTNTVSSVVSPASGAGPHPGTLVVYEVAPSGGTTEDPAVAYDTVSYEPILNVYQTLVNYNGTSTSTFIPTVATCVPGTQQCETDYGASMSGFTGIFNQNGDPENLAGTNGAPTYWTFVIDPAAHFYDPSTHASWPVYPSDVVFSVDRDMAWSNLPSIGSTPGWILTQSLLPFAHGAFTNNATNVLDSVLVNDSQFCPTSAIGPLGNGCVTFVATGEGQDWPFFLDLVADNLGASIVPCGWFTAQGASEPDFSGTHAADGDGSCLLPGGTNTTSSPAFASAVLTYDHGAGLTSWDNWEDEALGDPSVQPSVMFNMAGSGPYYDVAVSSSIGYTLATNPAYQQPSACGGNLAYAQYTGYCDPAVGSYIGAVDVKWEPSDSTGIANIGTDNSATADFAGIETDHTSTLLNFVAEGDLNLYSFGTISNFFLPFDLDYSPSAYHTAGFPGTPNIPGNFFQNTALRSFLTHAYPYSTAESTAWTQDGLQFLFPAGGPIPEGMGNYYPSNVSFPSGNPDTNPSDVGGAAWLWAQITNPTSQYYDSQLAGCTPSTPCKFPIIGQEADPSLDTAIGDYISEVNSLTGGALQPFTFDLSFPDLVYYSLSSTAGTNPMPYFNLGWAPDYPDPTDYLGPMAYPDDTYTAGDSVAESLALDNSTNVWNAWAFQGTSNTTQGWTDLIHWANAPNGTLNSSSGAAAYATALSYMEIAAPLSASNPARALYYNEAVHILNELALYVWLGQETAFTSAAPWILGSSINQNIMIGGGGDAVWFQVRYATGLEPVTFKETGLPKGASWSVGLGAEFPKNTTGTSIGFSVVNGSYSYTVTAPSGYQVYSATASSPLTVSGATTVTLKFGPYKGYAISIAVYTTPAFPFVQLPPNAEWKATLTKQKPVTSDNGSALIFTNITNGTYTYAISPPKGFGLYPANPFCSAQKGSVTISGVSQVVDVCFYEETRTLNITEKGYGAAPSAFNWSVSAVPTATVYSCGATGCVPFTGEVNSTNNSTFLQLTLPASQVNDKYTVTATFSAGWTGKPSPKVETVAFSKTNALLKLALTVKDPPAPAFVAAAAPRSEPI